MKLDCRIYMSFMSSNLTANDRWIFRNKKSHAELLGLLRMKNTALTQPCFSRKIFHYKHIKNVDEKYWQLVLTFLNNNLDKLSLLTQNNTIKINYVEIKNR